MDRKWERELLEASKNRGTKKHALRFAELVEQAADDLDEQAATVLMKTFTAQPDYGTQEEVIGVLQDARQEVRIGAILDALPRLVSEAREWAFELLCDEIKHNSRRFVEIAKNKPSTVQSALRTMYEDEEFANRCPSIDALDRLFK